MIALSLRQQCVLGAVCRKPQNFPSVLLSAIVKTVKVQSQKTQGFCVADFATLSDERRSRSKIFLLLIWIKEPCVRKFEGLARSKLLGISQTEVEAHAIPIYFSDSDI